MAKEKLPVRIPGGHIDRPTSVVIPNPPPQAIMVPAPPPSSKK